MIAPAPKLGEDPATLSGRGQPIDKAVQVLAAASGIYGSRIDLTAGARR